MIAELAAFNAAYATVKTAISHGRELSSCFKHIGIMVGAKAELAEKANKKRSGFLTKLRGQDANDLEEFMALEKMREAEDHLRQIMIYAGRPGLWGDWQRFQAEARKERQRAKLEAEQARERMWEYIGYFMGFLIILAACAGFIWYIVWLRG